MELLYLTFWKLRNLSFRGTPCVAIIAVKELVNIEQARSLRKQNNSVLESTDKTRDKAWEEKRVSKRMQTLVQSYIDVIVFFNHCPTGCRQVRYDGRREGSSIFLNPFLMFYPVLRCAQTPLSCSSFL